MTENAFINLLFTIIGFLLGLGAMSIWVMKRVDSLAVKMKAAEKDIEKLSEYDIHLQKEIEQAVSLHSKSLDLLTNVVNQNNFLIQKIVANGSNGY